MTMQEFLEKTAANVQRSTATKSVGRSIFFTILANAITLPFGFMSASIPRSVVSREEIVDRCEIALYGISEFRSIEERNAIRHFFDNFPDEDKKRILSVALNDPKKYREVIQRVVLPSLFPKRAA